ncbi:hypothetical protein TSUD_33890, partial [Trifolium subterraneum]
MMISHLHLQGTPVNIIVGSHVWVEDPEEAWVDGQVSNINGKDAEIVTTHGKKVVAMLSKIYLKDMEALPGGVDDMTKLSYLHEPGVLQNLKARYELNKIYTYTGNILIAINPFQRLPHIYGAHAMQQYKGAPPGELSPHVFAVADVAYRAMVNEGKSNSILVSGESGAGKTETTKMLMQFLAFLGGRAVTEGRTIEQQVLESNPVLEAFGNAKTARNNNSRCDADALEDALCKRVMITPEEVIKRSLDPGSATVSRDGLAKTIYSRLLVDKINNSIGQDPNSKCLIGVLDIYGFESFKLNSMFPKSTHETFANKLYQTFMKNKRFIKPKLSQTDFTIAHYAGEVTYQSDQFLDKNKDYVVPGHQELLIASTCPFVSDLFPPLPEETSKSSKFSSLGSRFKIQLQQLMETLSSTEPHYIRCVKPNNLLKPAIFKSVNIMHQLRCGGVLEAIRISCAGYPTRRPFLEFANRFSLLAPEAMEANCNEKNACQKILEKTGLKGYQIGTTKVFLRAGQIAELDARRAQLLSNAAKVIQWRVRTHQTRKHYLALRKKTIYAQSWWRGRLAFKQYVKLIKEASAVKIQKNIRGYEARKAYKELHMSVLTLQTALRAIAARKAFRFEKQTKASIIIQARWRCHKASLHYKRLKKGSIVTQCRWRGRLARRHLRKLKMAARDTDTLQDAKSKLEKQVEELTRRLQLETDLRAARDTDALQDAKSKLEKQVEELTRRLQLETDLRAARDTDALQEAKNKLEKQVEELTWRLQLEKGLRINLQEFKAQEVAKLQNSLQEMKRKVDEANALLLKERENAINAIEVASPVTKEVKVLVEDGEKIKTLKMEIEILKTSLKLEKQKAKDFERKYNQAKICSEERGKRLEDTEKKLRQLQESMTRLEGKITNLESENKVLRQQAASMAPNKFPSRLSRSSVQELHSTSMNQRESSEMEDKPQISLNEKQQKNEELIAACILYKCLLNWRSFEVEGISTSAYDCIIQTSGHAIE